MSTVISVAYPFNVQGGPVKEYGDHLGGFISDESSEILVPCANIWDSDMDKKILVHGGDVTDLYRISRLQFGVKSVVNTKT